jgi:hypothetical protein
VLHSQGSRPTTDPIPPIFDPPGSRLYHYTRLSTAIEAILPDWQLRLSPFSQMRDPRESKHLGYEAPVTTLAALSRRRSWAAQATAPVPCLIVHVSYRSALAVRLGLPSLHVPARSYGAAPGSVGCRHIAPLASTLQPIGERWRRPCRARRAAGTEASDHIPAAGSPYARTERAHNIGVRNSD